MKTVTIEVTQEDIDNGQKCSTSLCPIALASARCFANAGVMDTRLSDAPMVSVKSICMWHKGENWTKTFMAIKLPQEASTFITDFDKGKEVVPFSFTLTFEDG